MELEITGGNAEVAENKGIAEKATRKVMQGKKLKIDGSMLKQQEEAGSGFTTEVQRTQRGIGEEGTATALAGWGHLCLPFYAAAKWSARR